MVAVEMNYFLQIVDKPLIQRIDAAYLLTIVYNIQIYSSDLFVYVFRKCS